MSDAANIVIGAEHLAKRYRIGAQQEPYYTLRESVTRLVTAPFRRRPKHAPDATELWALDDVTEFGGDAPPEPTTNEEIVAAHDKSVARVTDILSKMSDDEIGKQWAARAKGSETTFFSMPKVALLRGLGMNHTYHHRGQLSVYLRLLDVPVPSIYGPSADENPFAART